MKGVEGEESILQAVEVSLILEAGGGKCPELCISTLNDPGIAIFMSEGRLALNYRGSGSEGSSTICGLNKTWSEGKFVALEISSKSPLM